MPELATANPPKKSGALHSFNLVLVTMCVMSLVAVTIMLIVLIWSDANTDLAARMMSTIGLLLFGSLLGLLVNSIAGRSLDILLAKICWLASWLCIVGGTAIGVIAIWLHVDHEEILLRTVGTIVVLFIASMIGMALAGTLASASRRDAA
jgi:hypothetical protein